MEKIKRGVSFLVRQVLALVLAVLLAVGSVIGAVLVGAIFAVIILVGGFFLAILVGLGPLLNITATATLEAATEGLKRATADLNSNVHHLRKGDNP